MYISENAIKNFGDFGANFWKKPWYSPCFFSKFDRFQKMPRTPELELRINSNFLHSIRTSMCIRNNGRAIFSETPFPN